jgi:hypothetical protein
MKQTMSPPKGRRPRRRQARKVEFQHMKIRKVELARRPQTLFPRAHRSAKDYPYPQVSNKSLKPPLFCRLIDFFVIQ